MENGTTTATNYTMSGKRLVHLSSGAHELHFFYDAQGRPAKVDYNGVIYTYVHNLQGDIVKWNGKCAAALDKRVEKY